MPKRHTHYKGANPLKREREMGLLQKRLAKEKKRQLKRLMLKKNGEQL